MKTPKRNIHMEPIFSTEDARNCRARWKRKNRITQLKHTIARLRWENFNMKLDLHIPLNISYDEYHSRRVDFTEKKPEPYFD